MTQLALYGGPLKRELIQQAYGECGQASWEFELENEEYAVAGRILDRMMAELRDMRGVDLGYNFPTVGAIGNPEDESGIPVGAVSAVVAGLALRIAPTMGKALSGETKVVLNRSFASLLANYVTTPAMQLGRNTIAGAGNRRWAGRPFLPSSEGSTEVVDGDAVVTVP